MNFSDNDTLITIHFDSSSCVGYLDRSPQADELANRWFGTYHGDRLVLNLVEVIYLMSLPNSKVIIKLECGDEISKVDELIKRRGGCFDKHFWPMLAVFKDLRDRGRRVRVLTPYKLLVKDKNGGLRLVYVLEEKSSFDIKALQSIVYEAHRNDLKATLAIVSLQGELTYYDIVPADIKVDHVD